MPRRFARESSTSGRRRRPISSSMLKVPNVSQMHNLVLCTFQTLICNNLCLLTGGYRCNGKGHTAHECPSRVIEDELQGKEVY